MFAVYDFVGVWSKIQVDIVSCLSCARGSLGRVNRSSGATDNVQVPSWREGRNRTWKLQYPTLNWTFSNDNNQLQYCVLLQFEDEARLPVLDIGLGGLSTGTSSEEGTLVSISGSWMWVFKKLNVLLKFLLVAGSRHWRDDLTVWHPIAMAV